MNPSVDRFLRWAPRVLCVAFAAFVSVFALDAFEPARGFWGNALAFGIHLFPTYLVIGVLVLGWRRPKAAGTLLIVVGCAYAVMPHIRQHLSWIAAISGPAWVTGVLFLVSPTRRLTGPG